MDEVDWSFFGDGARLGVEVGTEALDQAEDLRLRQLPVRRTARFVPTFVDLVDRGVDEFRLALNSPIGSTDSVVVHVSWRGGRGLPASSASEGVLATPVGHSVLLNAGYGVESGITFCEPVPEPCEKTKDASPDSTGTFSTVWDAAVVTAKMIMRQHALLPGGQWCVQPTLNNKVIMGPPIGKDTSNVLLVELGAGTGLVGLCAAACGAVRHVVLTDCPAALPSLEYNVKLNSKLLAKNASHVRVQPMMWGHDAASKFLQEESLESIIRHDGVVPERLVVVAADCILPYDSDAHLMRVLSDTITVLVQGWHLLGAAASAIVAYERRFDVSLFFDMLKENGLTWKAIPCDVLDPNFQDPELIFLFEVRVADDLPLELDEHVLAVCSTRPNTIAT